MLLLIVTMRKADERCTISLVNGPDSGLDSGHPSGSRWGSHWVGQARGLSVSRGFCKSLRISGTQTCMLVDANLLRDSEERFKCARRAFGQRLA